MFRLPPIRLSSEQSTPLQCRMPAIHACPSGLLISSSSPLLRHALQHHGEAGRHAVVDEQTAQTAKILAGLSRQFPPAAMDGSALLPWQDKTALSEHAAPDAASETESSETETDLQRHPENPNWHPPPCAFEGEVVAQLYASCGDASKWNTKKAVIENFKAMGMWDRWCAAQLNECQLKHFIRRLKSKFRKTGPSQSPNFEDQPAPFATLMPVRADAASIATPQPLRAFPSPNQLLSAYITNMDGKMPDRPGEKRKYCSLEDEFRSNIEEARKRCALMVPDARKRCALLVQDSLLKPLTMKGNSELTREALNSSAVELNSSAMNQHYTNILNSLNSLHSLSHVHSFTVH